MARGGPQEESECQQECIAKMLHDLHSQVATCMSHFAASWQQPCEHVPATCLPVGGPVAFLSLQRYRLPGAVPERNRGGKGD